MTLQIFLHFFHHKFVTSLQSTSLPSAASALSLRRIGDALLTPEAEYDRASGLAFS